MSSPDGASTVYAKLLLLERLGYPLWYPDLDENLSAAHRDRGIRIGDVGSITGTGKFKFYFNVHDATTHVPPEFQPWEELNTFSSNIQPQRIVITRGSVTNVSFETEEPAATSTGIGGGIEFTCSNDNSAILVLPDGACCEDLKTPQNFLQHLTDDVVLQWLDFTKSASLLLVTGYAKSPSWGVAAVSNASGQASVSLTFSASKIEGQSAGTYLWTNTSDGYHRVGPKPPTGKSNQCVFIRGYKLSSRKSLGFITKSTGGIIDIDGSITHEPRDAKKGGQATVQINQNPGSGTPLDTEKNWDALVEASSKPGSEDGEVVIEALADVSEIYHPSDVINGYLLQKFPDALVAITHDYDWFNLVEETDEHFPDDNEILRRVHQRYGPILKSGCARLVPLTTFSRARYSLLPGNYLRSIYHLNQNLNWTSSPVSSDSTTSPTQTHDELVPNSPARSFPFRSNSTHVSSSESSFTRPQTRRPSLSGFWGQIKALRRLSQQQCDHSSQITRIPPFSPILLDIPIPTGHEFSSTVQKSLIEIPVSSAYISTTPSDRKPPPTRVATPVTPTSPILRSKDGLIEAATLEDLVEQLITTSYLENAAGYRDIFFTTYNAFTTASDVFQILVHQFHNTTKCGQERTHLRINVITVMKYWVTRPHIQVDIDVLSQIKDFATSLAACEQTAKKMRELGEDLVLVTAERIHLSSGSPSSSKLLPSPTIVQPTPEELAIALTILEGDIFARILPIDCISRRQSQTNNNVKAAGHINKKIFNWVQSGILSAEDLEIRGEVLKYFVYTAEESHALRNFASMSAIVNALQSATIAPLGLTYNELPTDAKHKLQKMSDLWKPDHNYSAYKENLKRCKNEPRIPLLAVHMDDIEAVFQAQDTIKVGGTPLINFAKWTRFHDCMGGVFPHKPPDVSRYRQTKAGVQAYLEQQLKAIPTAPEFDEVLKAQSRKLVEAEGVQRTLGIQRLRAIGVR